jgi:hypothetical protein
MGQLHAVSRNSQQRHKCEKKYPAVLEVDLGRIHVIPHRTDRAGTVKKNDWLSKNMFCIYRRDHCTTVEWQIAVIKN